MFEVALIGTLGRDAEAKTSAAGKAYIRANIAIGNGDVTEWVNVAAFGSDPAGTSQLTKGAKVYVEGRLTVERWTGKDGAPRVGLSVAAWKLEPLGQIGKRRQRKPPAKRCSTTAHDFHDDTIPF